MMTPLEPTMPASPEVIQLLLDNKANINSVDEVTSFA
jgi:hypothetical protein